MEYQMNFLATLAPLVPGGFYWKNKQGIYLGCNNAFLEALNLTLDEIIGKTDEELWPEHAQILKRHDDKVLNAHETLTIEETFGSAHKPSKIFLVVKMPWKDPNNNFIGIIANAIDISQKEHINPIDRPWANSIAFSKNNAKKCYRILLVEDQTFAADITKIILSDLNCQVDLAPDSKTAILQAKNNNYDLIFMDIELSDLDGYETTKRIRLNELSKDKHVPIIALTAYIDNHDRERCLNVGMNAVLIKPLLKEKAQDMLNTFISQAEEVKIPMAANDAID